MPRNPVIQVSCEPSLYDKICTYKSTHNHTTEASAVRELLELALQVIERSGDHPTVSNRKILEEILKLTIRNSCINNHTFFSTFKSDEELKNCNQSNSKKSELYELADTHMNKFLAGNKMS